MDREPPAIFDALLPTAPGDTALWGQLHGAALALAAVTAARDAGAPLLVVAENPRQADRLESELRFFAAGDLPVIHFPDWETLPYDAFSPHPDIVSQRLSALGELPTLERGVVVVALGTLLQSVPPSTYVAAGTLQLDRGQELHLQEFGERLATSGYARVPQVTDHGEYALRGSLLDIFPMGSDAPYRIDLFDREIETIRVFDPETQLSGDKLESVRLLPAREFPLTPDSIREFRRRFRARFEGDPMTRQIYREVSDGIASGGLEYYIPLFFEETATLLDYLPENTVVLGMHGQDDRIALTWAEIEERYEQRRHDPSRPVLEPGELFTPPETLAKKLAGFRQIFARSYELEPGTRPGAYRNFGTRVPPRLLLDSRAENPAAALTEFIENFRGRILFAAESAGRRETLLELLQPHGLRVPVVEGWREFIDGDFTAAVTVEPLETGLLSTAPDLAVIAEDQLFGERARQRRHRRRVRDPETMIRELSDLSEGSPVVHEDYGVGRYRGLTTLEVGSVGMEFLTLEYAGGDRLYVPVHALQKITRWTGTSPEGAPLHKLGGDQWARARTRAAERIRDVAAELLDVYARREAGSGHRYRVAEHDYRAFAAEFPFETTVDQHQTIEQVKDDMANGRIMDRVVCGDVGFGKTEVALRAAFVAVMAGKQVAVLVPTTLLAQQHHQTFSDRFADWPVRVEVLSRFRSGKQASAILKGMREGTVDIVIGTHKLLQDDIGFKDLGLIVVDEEHRFGVRHKERLKKLRAEVDLLTLTATPIPRTLNMALGGLRDLSLIATPPSERLAIKTFVSEWNTPLIKEACLREIRRGGQVYFVHNSVQTIEKTANELAELLPEATVRVGHGQMRERELEQVMLDFYHRRFNVLVCTTIIESGIDVPTANTIVINRADRFGLAQLHQLRGRVGRSHHRAYAYLISAPRAAMTADAVKRLEAIESLEDLGAGFTLATHDLEIRGAGELLGEEQSGQIQEIGFALYSELLERAVASLKSGREPELAQPLDHGPEIDLRVPALLPEDYVPDVHMRLILYKRIANAADAEALRELQVEMIDRFGLLPAQAKLLFRITDLKLRAAPIGIRKIEAGTENGSITFVAKPNIDPLEIIELVRNQPTRFRLVGDDKLRFTENMDDTERRFSAVSSILDSLSTSVDGCADPDKSIHFAP